MTEANHSHYTAFQNFNIVARGTLPEIRQAVLAFKAARQTALLQVFNDETGEALDQDFERAPQIPPAEPETPPATESPLRKPGRPKLGVVAREVTLLPRHWQWLEAQPGGASVALRKLVESARKKLEPQDRIRHATDVTFRFMNVMCGHQPGYEDLTRALFQHNWTTFDALMAAYAPDIVSYLQLLSKPARPEYIDA
jgi:hypothetical protein